MIQYRSLLCSAVLIGICIAVTGCGGGSYNEGPGNINVVGTWTLQSYNVPNGPNMSCASGNTSTYTACSAGATFAATQQGTFTYSQGGTALTSGTYTVYNGNRMTTVFTVIAGSNPATYTEDFTIAQTGTELSTTLVSSTYPADRFYIGYTNVYNI